MPLSMTENARTKRARKALMGRGYTLFKSKAQKPREEYQLGYCIVKNEDNQIAWGPRYELSLDAVEAIVSDLITSDKCSYCAPSEADQQAA